MNNLLKLFAISFIIAFLAACEGPQGDIGPAGAQGEAGADGLNGADGQDATRPMQGDMPAGIPQAVWNAFNIEDRRTNTNPGDIGIGTASLVRDDFGYYFLAFSSLATNAAAGTVYDVYSTVSGAAFATQNGFDATEQPVWVGSISAGAGEQYVPLDAAPTMAEGGNQRYFDWVVIYPNENPNQDAPGIVADLDATNLLPRKTVWNPFQLEDRSAEEVATTNGYVKMITNQDQGRTRFWLYLNDFQGIGQPLADASIAMSVDRFAVFLGTRGAALAGQLADMDEPAYQMLGYITENGEQYFPLQVNSGDNPFFAPQRAKAGQERWYDWVLIYPVDADGNVLNGGDFGGIVADLDATGDLSENQRVIAD
ncbi:MAG: collagen-like protein [Cytophagales bacterium]|nr:collagen-like protein [Cytophagales bacterium]